MNIKQVIQLIEEGWSPDHLAYVLKEEKHFLDDGDYAEVFLFPQENKVLKINLYDTEEVKHEGIVLSNLQGLPCVPNLYYHKNNFIIMEYIKGMSISGYLQSHPPYTLRLNTLYYTLENIYRRGIIPRDISTYNTIVDFNGNINLIDFGMYQIKPTSKRHLPSFLKDPDIPQQVTNKIKHDLQTMWGNWLTLD